MEKNEKRKAYLKEYMKRYQKSEKRKSYKKQYDEKYRELNKEKQKEYMKDYWASYKEINSDLIKEKRKLYREKNKEKIKQKRINNRDKILEQKRKYRENNRDKIRKSDNRYQKNRRNNDYLFRLKTNIRSLIKRSFKCKNYIKNDKTFEILGCTFIEFKQYLESKFQPWMTWDNYGLYNGQPNYGWDIDHIIPQSLAKTEEDVLKLNNYRNLQPLCSYYNRNVKRSLVI